MARNQASSDHQPTSDEEDYIDMEVSPSSSLNFFCYSSPPHTKEFEFQMSSVDYLKQSTTSPADELFYNGTLLPLHLPPRLQMVQNIIQTSNTTKLVNQTQQAIDQRLNLSFIKTSNNNTPLDMSCNISPLDSPKVSSELNSDEYVCIGDDDTSRKSNWSKKLKQIKKSLMSPKIKASRKYVKSLFFKSATSESTETFAHQSLPFCSFSSESNAELENGLNGKKELLNKYMKIGKKNPFGKFDNGRSNISSTSLMKSIEREMAEENNGYIVQNRKSFSGAFGRHCSISSSSSSTTSSVSSSSSSSFSFSSSGCSDYSQFLKRSTSANCESESSIEGAIAHCKQSHQIDGVKRHT